MKNLTIQSIVCQYEGLRGKYWDVCHHNIDDTERRIDALNAHIATNQHSFFKKSLWILWDTLCSPASQHNLRKFQAIVDTQSTIDSSKERMWDHLKLDNQQSTCTSLARASQDRHLPLYLSHLWKHLLRKTHRHTVQKCRNPRYTLRCPGTPLPRSKSTGTSRALDVAPSPLVRPAGTKYACKYTICNCRSKVTLSCRMHLPKMR